MISQEYSMKEPQAMKASWERRIVEPEKRIS
jgi:hypothetical protein